MTPLLFDEIDPEVEANKIREVRSQKIVLRDYQLASVDGIYREWEQHCSTLLVLPTGTGKSVCFSEVMRRWDGGKILLMAHRKELIYQAVGHARRAGLKAGMEMGPRWCSGDEDVMVSTVQTLMADMKCQACFGEGCDGCDGVGKVKRVTRFDPFEFGMVTIDEGHHAIAKSYRTVIKWFQRNDDNKLLLVTATPKRSDKKGMRNVCDSVAFKMQLKEAIDLGWLVPIRQKFVTVDGLDLSQVNTSKGDLAAKGVQEAFLGTDENEERLLHAIAKPTLDEASGQQIIVFSSGKDHAEKLTAAFNSYDGVTAAFVTESTKESDREQIVGDFKSGAIQVLVNCMVFTEGFDAPAVSVVANCRPTKSEALYSQIIGRVTRPLPGVVDGPALPELRRDAIAASRKPHAVVLDFVGNSGRHKLISVVDVLAGDDVEAIDMDAALAVAVESDEPVDMEELVERMRQVREEEEKRIEEQKARRLMTNTFATRADYSAVDVDLFSGATFDSYNDPREATKSQRWMLKESCGIPWRRSGGMSESEARDRIATAKRNAKETWKRGIQSAQTISELAQFGQRIAERKDSDRLISSTATIVELKQAYKAKLAELRANQ